MLPSRRLFLLAPALASLPVLGLAAEPAAKVLFMGLFHFDNPGLDAVKYKPVDVMQPAAQRYLVELSRAIATRFKPTKVLLEYGEKNDALINQRYADYLAGKFELRLNEIYQIGFRVAQNAGLLRVEGIDVQAPPGGDALWGYLDKGAPEANDRLMKLISELSARSEREHRSLSLRELLMRSNTEQADRENKGFYMLLNDVAADKRLFHGADASASWWHRNLRMYALVQQHAKAGERVLVIAGSGHTAILRDLLRADGDRVEEPVAAYF